MMADIDGSEKSDAEKMFTYWAGKTANRAKLRLDKTSISLRLIYWLQRVGNHSTEQVVQYLCRREAHSQPLGNVDYSHVLGIHNARAQGKVYDPVKLSGLGNEIDVLNSGRVID